MTNTSLSNPAAVGFAGFGGTTLLLQFHNLGFSGVSGGPKCTIDRTFLLSFSLAQ